MTTPQATTPSPSSNAPPAPLTTTMAEALLPGRAWANLAEAVAALERQSTDHALRFTKESIPRPDTNLATTMQAAITALDRGDFRGWLGGRAGRALGPAGRAELIAELAREFGQFVRLANDVEPGQWRLFLLPLFDGNEWHPIRFFSRQQGQQDDENEGSSAGKRFIVEVELTRLGAIQLDGLVNANRFDLMVRSRHPIAAAAQRNIEKIFQEALELSEVAGRLQFQVAAEFPVDPTRERAGEVDAAILV
ncbi:MAG: hypothetical protein V3V17_05375 [Alphaproteobacteria bacterium]|nr:hypothetical protein [Pseudomonadota bacterium]